MAKKLGYSPVSIIAAVCETIATAAAASNPVTAPFAVGIGTAASAIVGGTELNEKEQSVKEKLDNALDEAWTTIDNKYRISFNSEDCLLELKREMMGGSTSVDEINRNLKNKKLENSLSIIIRNILGKYREILNRDAEIIWDDAFLDGAALDIATIMVKAIRSVFENVDHLLLLKAIAESADRIVREIKESEGRITDEIRNQKQAPVMVPSRLTDIPPSVNLIGRDKDIEAIIGLLEQHDIVSIHAYGGVGKTAVAKKIINDVKRDVALGKSPYKHVAWITRTGDLKSDFTALNFPFVNEKNTQEENYQQVCTFFQSTPTFLVIDNIDSPLSSDEIVDLNTIVGQTKVLITARADIEYVEEYPLGELDIEDALVLLYWHFTRRKMTIDKIKERADYPFAEKIVEAATRNALFIELIGKMAYADHWTLEHLWESLCKDVFGLDSRYPIEYVAHGDDGKLLEHIRQLYRMSNLSERQKEIMSFIALFPPEYSIFFDVFKWAGFGNDKVNNLGELQKRGWIERGDEGYLIHTMVKGSIEQQQGEVNFDEERYGELIDELADTDQYIPSDMEYPKVRERIMVLENICGLLAKSESNKDSVAELYDSLALKYSEHGKHDKAIEYYQRALTIFENTVGTNHHSTAITYHNIAMEYLKQKQYERSLEGFKKALLLYDVKLQMKHPVIAALYGGIALVYEAKGDYDKAKEYLLKGLTLQKEELGDNNHYISVTYNHLGGLYRYIGQDEKALEYYMMSEKIDEQLGEKNNPSKATLYLNMAKLYLDNGQYDEALKYSEMAREIYEKVLGEEHEYTLIAYKTIALVYERLGQYENALKYYNKLLVTYEKIVEVEQMDIAWICNSISGIYIYQRNYEEALKYFEKARAIEEKVQGKESLNTAVTYGNMAFVYDAQGNYEKAMEYYEKALSVFLVKLGEENHHTKAVRKHIESLQKR